VVSSRDRDARAAERRFRTWKGVKLGFSDPVDRAILPRQVWRWPDLLRNVGQIIGGMSRGLRCSIEEGISRRFRRHGLPGLW